MRRSSLRSDPVKQADWQRRSRKPLARTAINRGKAVKAGSTLKPGKRKRRPSLTEFHEHARANGCALAYLGGCGGVFRGHMVWGHHYVPKQRLKHDDDAYADPRNAVGLCVIHHAQVENRRLVCPRPPELDEFLAEFGIPDPDQRSEAA